MLRPLALRVLVVEITAISINVSYLRIYEIPGRCNRYNDEVAKRSGRGRMKRWVRGGKNTRKDTLARSSQQQPLTEIIAEPELPVCLSGQTKGRQRSTTTRDDDDGVGWLWWESLTRRSNAHHRIFCVQHVVNFNHRVKSAPNYTLICIWATLSFILPTIYRWTE